MTGQAKPGAHAPRRISVVGSTGSGKTFLARKLSARLGLPLVELDHLRGCADTGHAGEGGSFGHAIRSAVACDRWIIDGHYRQFRDLVWNEADLVILLDYPLHVILRQLWKRYRGKPSRREGRIAGDLASESASWRRRLRRLGKTMAERREYRALLGRLENAEHRVKRFRDPESALAWIEGL